MGSFFLKFAENQYQLYSLIHSKPGIHKLYEGCYRDNLHSIWAEQELYRPGNTKEIFFAILDKNMHPVYDSARRQGYELWNYDANMRIGDHTENGNKRKQGYQNAFCAVWRTLMRFPADIVQSITDAGKRNVLPTTVSP